MMLPEGRKFGTERKRPNKYAAKFRLKIIENYAKGPKFIVKWFCCNFALNFAYVHMDIVHKCKNLKNNTIFEILGMLPNFLTSGCFFKASLAEKCCEELATLEKARNLNSWLQVTYQWRRRFFGGRGMGGGGCCIHGI